MENKKEYNVEVKKETIKENELKCKICKGIKDKKYFGNVSKKKKSYCCECRNKQ